MTIRLDEATTKSLSQVAKATGRTRSVLAQQAPGCGGPRFALSEMIPGIPAALSAVPLESTGAGFECSLTKCVRAARDRGSKHLPASPQTQRTTHQYCERVQ